MNLFKQLLALIFFRKKVVQAHRQERHQIRDIDQFPDPHWVMFVPVLSTGHIGIGDANLLDMWNDMSKVVPMEFGWLIYVGEDNEHWELYPKTVRDICAWALKRSYTWVRLDRDGDFIDALPHYDW